MSSALKQQLLDSTHSWLERARPLLRSAARVDPNVEIRCDLRGKSAGQLQRYNNGQLLIRYNLQIAELQPESFIEQTVPHEVAHIITWLCHGKRARSHGREWQSVMQFFGFPQAPRCHNFALPKKAARQQRRWHYQCQCQQHWLSTTRHNRISKGQRYYCRRCNTEIVSQKQQQA